MYDEQLTILRMLQEHSITRQNAIQLLTALEACHLELLTQVEDGSLRPEQAIDRMTRTSDEGKRSVTRKWLRIHVQKSGENPVNIRVPLGLMNMGMRLLGRTDLKIGGVSVSAQDLWTAIQSETAGTLLQVDDQGGEHVEFIVE